MNSYENQLYIVGGSGFLGSALTRTLSRSNYSYLVCDIKKNNYLNNNKNLYRNLDIEKPETLKDFMPGSTIINLAAVHRDDVHPLSRYYDVNVEGSANICEAARNNNINKIIFTSSVAIYGFAPPDTDESGEPNYFNEYGRTKYLAEQVYRKWQSEDPDNRTLVIIRPTVIFGEGNRGNVYNLLKQIALGRFVMFGNGKNKKSMAYVENVAAFVEHSLTFKPGLHIYNYIDKPDFDMNALVSIVRKTLFGKNNVGLRLPFFLGMLIGYLADFVAKALGKTLPVSSIRVKKFMGTTQFATSLSETRFVPSVTLEEGIVRTLRYEFLEDNSDKQTFKTE